MDCRLTVEEYINFVEQESRKYDHKDHEASGQELLSGGDLAEYEAPADCKSDGHRLQIMHLCTVVIVANIIARFFT